MVAQTSTLRIIVDSVGAKKNAEALDKQMKSLEKSGDAAKTSTGKLNNEFKNNGGLGKYREGILKLSSAVGLASGAILGATTAVAGFAVAYAKSARELQNMAVLADANVVEFQRMAVAAERYGVSQEQLSDQLKDFNEKLGEFVLTGKGEGVDAFEVLAKHTKMTAQEVGAFALEMQKASGPQALLMYVERLEKAGVSSEQMSFLVENMGNDFTKLLPILRNGGAELKKLADEAERLGVIMDEKTVAQAIELESQIALLQKTARGAANQFMSGFVPALTDVAKGLNEGAVQSDLMKSAGEDLGSVLKGVTAIAVGAYVAISSVTRAITGLAKDAAKTKKAVDIASSNQGFLSNLPGVKWTKALILGSASVTTGSGETGKALNKNAELAEDYANFMDKLFKEVSENANKELGKVGSNLGKDGLKQGLNTFYEDMNKEAKKAADKANSDAERLAKEQAEMRISIAYSYLDELAQMEENYQRELVEIRKAGFGAEQAEFEKRAKERYDHAHEMYLIQITEEINSFKWSENQKLDHWKRTQQEIIESSGRYNDEIKQLKIKALDEEYMLEKAKIEVARKQREFSVRKQFMSETEAMKERYALEEAEILLINDAHERAHMLQLKRLEKEIEVQNRLNAARGAVDAINTRRNGTGEFDAIYNAQAEANNASAELAEAEVLAGYKSKEQAQEEHLDRMRKNAEEANRAMLNLQFSYGESISGSLADMFKTMRGEQSRGYKIMFAASKAFAIAQSTIAITQGIAQAAANPFPYNLAAMAVVASQTASLVANIKSIKDVGFAEGGYTGNGGKYDVAGLVHRGEVVFSKADVARNGGVQAVEDIRKGGGSNGGGINVIINTPAGYTATTREDSNGVTIDIVEQVVQKSWGNLSKPNSNESRSVQRAFGLQPAR